MPKIRTDSEAYSPNQRFVVKIEDKDTKRIFYCRGVRTKKEAILTRDHYELIKDFTTTLFDTKSGEEIKGVSA